MKWLDYSLQPETCASKVTRQERTMVTSAEAALVQLANTQQQPPNLEGSKIYGNKFEGGSWVNTSQTETGTATQPQGT